MLGGEERFNCHWLSRTPRPTRCPSPRLFKLEEDMTFAGASTPLHQLELEKSSAVAVLLYMNHRRRSIITSGRVAISTTIKPGAATPMACSSHYKTQVTAGQQKRLLAHYRICCCRFFDPMQPLRMTMLNFLYPDRPRQGTGRGQARHRTGGLSGLVLQFCHQKKPSTFVACGQQHGIGRKNRFAMI